MTSFLSNRELDARVAEVCFGGSAHENRWTREVGGHLWESPLPHFSSSWDRYGEVIERMRELGYDFRRYADCVAFVREGTEGPHSVTVEWMGDIRRPTCIAAILAVQGEGP